jgi:PAS domain S-box-containing protein
MHDGDSQKAARDVPSMARVPVEDAAFLRSVLETLPCYVVQLDPERRVRYVNRLRDGYTLDDVIGRSIRDFSAPEDLEVFEVAADDAMRTGQTQTYMARGSGAGDGRERACYQGYVVPVDDADGRRALTLVASDVSDHVARAEALEESRERLRLAVEATGIGLWTWDVADDRLTWDRRTGDILGHDPIPAQAYVREIVHPEDRKRVTEALAEAAAGRPRFVQHRVVQANGDVRWVQPCGRVILNDAGEVARLIGGILDVTPQRMVDERLRNAQKLDAVGSLTAGIAHNFNNMLAGMIPAIELSLASCPTDLEPIMREALHAAQRSTELIRQLMTYAGQRPRGALAAHDLALLLERVVSLCERTFQSRVEIELRIDAACGPAKCEPHGVEQAVMNLLINARDAVLEAERTDPKIVVELEQTLATYPDSPAAEPLPFVRVRVRDNGIGMSPEVQQRLFEPFHTTKAPGKGTGLGLATSRRIVDDQGGFILFDSEPQVGTTASIFLPLSHARPERARGSPVVEPAAHRGKVLVVDDDKGVCNVVGRLLSERGHEVRLAADGEAAALVLDSGWQPDVILLDRFMPGWDATRTMVELRARAEQTAIIYHCGQLVPDDERTRAQAVIQKPAQAVELYSTVEQFISRG